MSTSPPPNSDLPQEIRDDFEEARSIVSRSPRGAAALFRLCLQKLCAHLGESGKDINADIAALVRKGLDARIQKSLDLVRIIGNNAVHPGTIDLNDTPEIANRVALLINIIVDALITQPKMIDGLYSELSEAQIQQIEKRDSNPSA